MTTTATQSAYLDIVWETRADGLNEGRVADLRFTIKPMIDGTWTARMLDQTSRTGWSAAIWGQPTLEAAKAWCQEQCDIELARRGEI